MASNWQPQAAEAMAGVLTRWAPFEENDVAERERLLAAVVAKFNEFLMRNGSPSWGPNAETCIRHIVSIRLLPVKGYGRMPSMMYGCFCTFELVRAIRAGERLAVSQEEEEE